MASRPSQLSLRLERVFVFLDAELARHDARGLLLPGVFRDRRLVEADSRRTTAFGPKLLIAELALEVRMIVKGGTSETPYVLSCSPVNCLLTIFRRERDAVFTHPLRTQGIACLPGHGRPHLPHRITDNLNIINTRRNGVFRRGYAHAKLKLAKRKADRIFIDRK